MALYWKRLEWENKAPLLSVWFAVRVSRRCTREQTPLARDRQEETENGPKYVVARKHRGTFYATEGLEGKFCELLRLGREDVNKLRAILRAT